jgi:hypothetical protein
MWHLWTNNFCCFQSSRLFFRERPQFISIPRHVCVLIYEIWERFAYDIYLAVLCACYSSTGLLKFILS